MAVSPLLQVALLSLVASSAVANLDHVAVAAAGEATLMRRQDDEHAVHQRQVRVHVQDHTHPETGGTSGAAVTDPEDLSDAQGEAAESPAAHANEETEVDSEKANNSHVYAGEARVNCGAHTASRCRLCTVVDPQTGEEIKDRGQEWCHGDCSYYEDECHQLTPYNLHKTRDNRTKGWATPPPSMASTLTNPNMTAEDRALMDQAADRAIQEEEFESSSRLSALKWREKAQSFTGNKFIFIAVMAGTFCLVLQAIAAVYALYQYSKKDGKKDAAKRPLRSQAQES